MESERRSRLAAVALTAGFDDFKRALDVGRQLNDPSANTAVAVAGPDVLQQEFTNKTPAEQFRAPSAASDGVQDPSPRAAASMERNARARLQRTRSANCGVAGAANFRAQQRGVAMTSTILAAFALQRGELFRRPAHHGANGKGNHGCFSRKKVAGVPGVTGTE